MCLLQRRLNGCIVIIWLYVLCLGFTSKYIMIDNRVLSMITLQMTFGVSHVIIDYLSIWQSYVLTSDLCWIYSPIPILTPSVV